jgi:hypothetical protein
MLSKRVPRFCCKRVIGCSFRRVQGYVYLVRKKEEMMKRKKMFPAIFLLTLFLLSCATTQQITTKVVPDTARVVRLYVPACT